jgi:hypothetical protein
MQVAGIEGEQVVLLLEDHQFVEPQFLELINSLLSAGEVPGLYTPEEIEPLLAPLREMASDAGFRGTLVQYFASRTFFIPLFLCLLRLSYVHNFFVLLLFDCTCFLPLFLCVLCLLYCLFSIL